MGIWLAAVLLAGVADGPQEPVEPVARMKAWFSAVERHQPGTTDAWLTEIGAWSRFGLGELSADLVVFLDRFDEAHGTKQPRPRPRPSRRRPRHVTAAIRALAGDVLGQDHIGPFDPFGRGRPDSAALERANQFLMRAALLHADIAMLGPATPDVVAAPPPVSADPLRRRQKSSPGPIVVQTEDGLALDFELATAHWGLGRTLLSAVAPDPARDETVVLWYRATVAYLQREEKFGDCLYHMKAALDAIPGDARLLFYAGAMYESFASGPIQAAARSLESRGNLKSTVRSVEEELEDAEKFFRKALDVDPQFVEAGLRLGRVFGLLGRHEDAAAQLRQAIARLEDSQLVYYGELFLGHEEAAMRRRDSAREHFERAAALYPRAQSPRLAMSLLARTYGDRQAALQSAREVFALPPHEEDRDDPWWGYHTSHVRDADALLEQLRRPFLKGATP
jgi:tetratricopeptide (TPR) repeat protein